MVTVMIEGPGKQVHWMQAKTGKAWKESVVEVGVALEARVSRS